MDHYPMLPTDMICIELVIDKPNIIISHVPLSLCGSVVPAQFTVVSTVAC